MTWDALLQILKGLGVGGVGAGLFHIFGKLIARNTTLTTARMKDRADHIVDLTAENRELEARVKQLEGELREMRLRDVKLTKFATYFGAHVEMLTGLAKSVAESTRRLADAMREPGTTKSRLTPLVASIADFAGMLEIKMDAASKTFEHELMGYIEDPFKDTPVPTSISTPKAMDARPTVVKVEVEGPKKAAEE